MSTITHQPTKESLSEATSGVRGQYGWLIALGVLQILAGMAALTFAFSATLASVAFLGCILLLASGAQVAAAIMARSWKGVFLFLLVGTLYGVIGVLTLAHPIAAAEGLTLMLAAALICGGAFRIAVVLVERLPSWGWVLANGLLSVLLGVLIAAQWPISGLWVIGTFVGIDLMVNGIAWIMLCLEARKMSAPPTA
jgi:uncharacterized membrane protein HdeD (DUF308 family)